MWMLEKACNFFINISKSNIIFEKTEQFDAGGCEMRDFFFLFHKHKWNKYLLATIFVEILLWRTIFFFYLIFYIYSREKKKDRILKEIIVKLITVPTQNSNFIKHSLFSFIIDILLVKHGFVMLHNEFRILKPIVFKSSSAQRKMLWKIEPGPDKCTTKLFSLDV